MNGSLPREHLRLVSDNANPLKLELSNNKLAPGKDSLVKNARNTFLSIGDGFSDISALALYDAKALKDAPAFAKEFLYKAQQEIPENFYTNISGEAVLVKTLSLYAEQKGLYYSKPENIVITAGAVNAFYGICASLCDAGDVILALSPSYILFSHTVKSFGAEMVLVPSSRNNKYVIDPSILDAQIKSILASGKKIKAILIVNPTNIDSQCWTERDINNLAPILENYNFPIIEDRVYDGLQYDAPEDASFFALHPSLAHRTITIDSVSKRYGATQWRIGWVQGPEALIERVRETVMQTVWSPNSKYQIATALMILAGLEDSKQQQALQNETTHLLASKAIQLKDSHVNYFNTLHEDYILRRNFSFYLIHGIRKYKDLRLNLIHTEDSLIREFKDILPTCKELQSGITGFSAPILPQAGMFLLIQADSEVFDRLSSYQYPDLIFARLLYKEGNVVMLPNTELTLPDNERMFRIEFGVELDVLIQSLKNLNTFTKKFISLSNEDISDLIETHFKDRNEICLKKESFTKISA